MWPAVVGAGVAGIASAFGQHRANQTNIQLAREGMAFSADQTAKQMAFQERMSSTAHQRAVADMRAAGLNPILAAGSAASSPSGAGASGMAPTVESSLGRGVSSAVEGARMAESLKLIRAQRTGAEALAEREVARNRAYGIMLRKDGSVSLDLSMPGMKDLVGAEISSAKAQARLAELSIPEREALAKLFQQVGAGGKGAQMFLPLLMSIIRR